MKKKVITSAALMLVLGLSGACGDEDDDLDNDSGVQNDAAQQDDAAAGLTFTELYTEVISVQCQPCHTANAAGGLSMADRDTAYDNLVGVAAAGGACGSGGKTRVVASDSASSLIFQKVSEATPSCGVRMPASGPPFLSAAEIAQIEQWIDDGAKDD